MATAKQNHISVSIHYAGLILPIGQTDTGVEIVPFKPLVAIFGLDWTTQYNKVNGPWLSRFLGVCVGLMPYAADQTREQVCIRLDRVAAYLMTISPDRVRVNGAEDVADFLEAKLTEWADALHDYESFGVAHNPRHADALLALRRANAIAKAASIKDARVRALALAELGIDPAAPSPSATPPAPGATGDLFPPAAA